MSSKWQKFTFSFSITDKLITKIQHLFEKRATLILFFLLTMISITTFLYYLSNELGLKYNDARSHLDIARRVVENLKPGFAQLGSVWLPLPHLLTTLTVWNDFMWHSGLAGALQSMISFVVTGIVIYKILSLLKIDLFGRLVGILVFILNLNILYMQSTAMTELLLIGTMTLGVYELLCWHSNDRMNSLVKAGLWIMLSTLIRYDGWFLLIIATILIAIQATKKHGLKTAEGVVVVFGTLASFGIVLWLFWNLVIFKDPLYFITGPYAAATQQQQLSDAGVLATKHNLLLSLKTYIYAVFYNSGVFHTILAVIGICFFWLDKHMKTNMKFAAFALLAPFFFNILALYLGQSVLYVEGLQGSSWFNVRYGLMMVPSIAIFIGYLVHRLRPLRYVILSLLLFASFFAFVNHDAVTIDDAVYGASGKNVQEVSGWLKDHAINTPGFILISVASHDAILFSSGLPMSRFIHEGTGLYWDVATMHPSRWARWIIVRTHDTNDQTFRLLQYNKEFHNDYSLQGHFPFADIYEVKPKFLPKMHMQPSLEL
jgi:hypothetical protein